jgi:hypothetical protein
MPGPWSRTVSTPAASATSTGPSGGPNLAALSSRFLIATCSRWPLPEIWHGWSRAAKAVRGQSRRAAASAAATTSSSRTSSCARAADSPRASSVTLLTSWPSSAA